MTKRRAAITKFEQAQARRNAASKEIGDAKKAKDEAKASKLMAEVTELKTSLPTMEAESRGRSLLDSIRSWNRFRTCHSTMCLTAQDASGNVEHHVFGKKRDYSFKPKQHFELGEALGQMDFELQPNCQARDLWFCKSGLARLGARARSVHARSACRKANMAYTEVNPPILVRDEVMFGTAQLPKVCGGPISERPTTTGSFQPPKCR